MIIKFDLIEAGLRLPVAIDISDDDLKSILIKLLELLGASIDKK